MTQARPLGELVTVVGGGTPSRSCPEYFGGDIPWLTAKDMKRWDLDSSLETITQQALKESAAQLVPVGSILIVIRSGILKHSLPIGIARRPLAINQDLKALVPKDGVDSEYLARYLQSRAKTILHWVRATTADNFPLDELKSLEVTLPAGVTQRRLGQMLTDADQFRRGRRYALELSSEFVPAVFHEIFGEPVRNTKGWRCEPIRDLGDVSTGGTPRRGMVGMFGGGIPFVTPGDLEVDTLHPQRFLTESGAAETGTVRSGATLVCCIGATIGKTDKARARSAFNQQINAIQWGNRIDDEFGHWLMRFFSDAIAQRGHSTTLPILKKSAFEGISVPTPPLPLQKRFAEIVECHVRLLAAQQESLRQAEHLFQTLLHQVFH
jgi:type I restriction enzyme, S subunit